MSDRGLDRLGTILLAEKLVRVSWEIESVIRAEFRHEPRWWLIRCLKVLEFVRHRKLKSLMSYRNDLVSELSVRYDSIMFDLFTCAGNNTSFSTYFSQVWRELQGRAVTARDPRRFSTCLWEILRGQGATIDELQAKFMLRQFVDDMPDGEPRAALKLFAYSSDPSPGGWPQAGREAARMVKKGYALLHERVCARADDLELITGGVLNARTVGGIHSPYAQYDEWLFYVC